MMDPSWIEMWVLRSDPKSRTFKSAKNARTKNKRAKRQNGYLHYLVYVSVLGWDWAGERSMSNMILLTHKQGSFCFFLFVFVLSWRNLTLNCKKKKKETDEGKIDFCLPPFISFNFQLLNCKEKEGQITKPRVGSCVITNQT